MLPAQGPLTWSLGDKMNVSRSVVIAAMVALTAGGFGGYALSDRATSQMQQVELYGSSAAQVRLLSLVLTEQRTGSSEKATKMLEDLLEANLVTLTYYERDVPPSRR